MLRKYINYNLKFHRILCFQSRNFNGFRIYILQHILFTYKKFLLHSVFDQQIPVKYLAFCYMVIVKIVYLASIIHS
jgi:hypothetical protein